MPTYSGITYNILPGDNKFITSVYFDECITLTTNSGMYDITSSGNTKSITTIYTSNSVINDSMFSPN